MAAHFEDNEMMDGINFSSRMRRFELVRNVIDQEIRSLKVMFI